ncbi:hypothetical protein [Jiella sonneratiae]|uniref:Uncharacterized protein n=1 Tax=Jiella sonneratiae TaxID=2816856 RepID=A0ABS3J7D9_9HYPH|nr:hypothetical protein [Jiella sonneratiae]MBO0905565.1 hypothetical protein [Jiella sonneratiae]
MSRKRGFVSHVSDFFADFRAARECAAAVEAGRRPREAALRHLGLNAGMFDRQR